MLPLRTVVNRTIDMRANECSCSICDAGLVGDVAAAPRDFAGRPICSECNDTLDAAIEEQRERNIRELLAPLTFTHGRAA